MTSWTRHLARLFRIAGKPASAEPERPAEPVPPPRNRAPPSESDSALVLACDALRARNARSSEVLAGIPEGDWRRFADAVAENDSALREALDRVADMPAESVAGLRAKADAMGAALDGVGEDAERASRIARSLIADALAVLPPPPDADASENA